MAAKAKVTSHKSKVAAKKPKAQKKRVSKPPAVTRKKKKKVTPTGQASQKSKVTSKGKAKGKKKKVKSQKSQVTRKKVAGRPNTYRRSFRDVAMATAALGGGASDVAKACKVSIATVYGWLKTRPSFLSRLPNAAMTPVSSRATISRPTPST